MKNKISIYYIHEIQKAVLAKWRDCILSGNKSSVETDEQLRKNLEISLALQFLKNDIVS
jgi:hypothetical protein